MDRDEKRKKLMAEIKKRVKELEKMGFTLSDCASTITLFDDRMFEGRHFVDLTQEEQMQCAVDSL
jgi:hypothetical protein